jgi:ribonuclease D
LRALCAQLLGFEMAKDQQTGLWDRRPLTKAQVRYAALDVAVLGPICEATWQTAQVLGLLDQVHEDSNRRVRECYARYESQHAQLAAADMSERVERMLQRAHSKVERRRILAAAASLPIFHAHKVKLDQYRAA